MFLVSLKIHKKTLANTILDSYVVLQILNMFVEKIHQPQNSGYLQGEEKGNRIKGTHKDF